MHIEQRQIPAHRIGQALLTLLGCLAICWMASVPALASAQPSRPAADGEPHAKQAAQTVPVLMLSDVHFDPWHDPALFHQLQAAPVSRWPAILSEPPSPDQPKRFAALQQACSAHGVDTDWTLLQSSLAAMQLADPHPDFVTLSGDLTAHEFRCRFEQLDPQGSDADYVAYAAKVASFVAYALKHAYPKTPIFIALGNNDSSCGDYRESIHSQYLRRLAVAVASAAPAVDRATILREFPAEGDYDVALPAPFVHTRLIVLQDIFEASNYSDCQNHPDPQAAARQIAWLGAHLAMAHAHGDQVWVMSHIPPGVNVYQTIRSNPDVCGHTAPSMFLNSDQMVQVLLRYAGEIRFAIFAHTHNDELRLLAPPAAFVSGHGAIPVKLVPSITPVHGNNPAFMMAEVDRATAIVKDYTIIVASNQTGVHTQWTPEYRWSTAYGENDFSASSVAKLITHFEQDPHSETEVSRNYQQWFYAGRGRVPALLLRFFWPAYACSLNHMSAEGYRQCVCGATPQAH